MISATDQRWNSPNTLYIARRLHEIAGDRRKAVLDVGCGDGRTLEHLLGYNYDLYGYDLVSLEDRLHETRKQKLGAYFGASFNEHIRLTSSDRTIPFDSDSFDVLYANQVFEHVRFLDKIVSECARVLKPGGTLLANFPLATNPVELHVGVPFAHWIPPGVLRVRYMQLWSTLGFHRILFPGGAEVWKRESALETAIAQEDFLREEAYYRFVNEIMSISRYYFDVCEVETDALLRAKIDLLMVGEGSGGSALGSLLQLMNVKSLSHIITYAVNAAFCMSHPKAWTCLGSVDR
jgi:SAM-dependent methyltransferase